LYGVDSTGKTFAFTDLTPTTGVNEVIASNTISVYPNPASGAINVVTNNGEAATIRITSMNGKMVLNQSVNQTENTVNISDLTSGIYFYEVNTQNAVSRGKLIVQ
jgi:hypothetical protein